MGHTRQVVERVDELLRELRLRARACLLPLPHAALAIIVVLGSEAEVLVPLLIELAGDVVGLALLGYALVVRNTVPLRRRALRDLLVSFHLLLGIGVRFDIVTHGIHSLSFVMPQAPYGRPWARVTSP